MGWYGRDNITKYYSIGFTEEELQEIDAARKKQIYGTSAESSFYSKRTNFIKHLIFSCIDLEKENQRLKSTIRETRAQAAAMGQSGASEVTTFRDRQHKAVCRLPEVLFQGLLMRPLCGFCQLLFGGQDIFQRYGAKILSYFILRLFNNLSRKFNKNNLTN